MANLLAEPVEVGLGRAGQRCEGVPHLVRRILRWAAGRDPDDRDLSDLVGELATHSEAFRTRWAVHDAAFTLSTANGGEPFGQHGKEGRRRRL
jgi:hypothetical protein